MSHYRIDAAKYERHAAEVRKNIDRVEQLLPAIGSMARAKQAIREAVQDGRVPADLAEAQETLVEVVATRAAPEIIHQPEPAVMVDQRLLDELVELLHKSIQLMRFSNFVILPGGSPED